MVQQTLKTLLRYDFRSVFQPLESRRQHHYFSGKQEGCSLKFTELEIWIRNAYCNWVWKNCLNAQTKKVRPPARRVDVKQMQRTDAQGRLGRNSLPKQFRIFSNPPQFCVSMRVGEIRLINHIKSTKLSEWSNGQHKILQITRYYEMVLCGSKDRYLALFFRSQEALNNAFRKAGRRAGRGGKALRLR